MKSIAGLGKALTLVFWWLALVNLFMPLVHPFSLLIHLASVALLLVHLFEIVMFNTWLKHRRHPWFDRLQILLVGIFHLQALSAPVTRETSHA